MLVGIMFVSVVCVVAVGVVCAYFTVRYLERRRTGSYECQVDQVAVEPSMEEVVRQELPAIRAFLANIAEQQKQDANV